MAANSESWICNCVRYGFFVLVGAGHQCGRSKMPCLMQLYYGAINAARKSQIVRVKDESFHTDESTKLLAALLNRSRRDRANY